MTNTESCIRDDGLKLEPLKISLEAFVELPVLTLLNVFNYQLIFKVILLRSTFILILFVVLK